MAAVCAPPAAGRHALPRAPCPAVAAGWPHAARAEGAASGAEGALSVIEDVITAAASKILDGKQVRRTDNFFDIGLHAVSIARMRRLLQEDLGPLPRAAFFEHASAARLAAFVAAAAAGAPAGEALEGAGSAGPGAGCAAGGDLGSLGDVDPAEALSRARLALRFGGRGGAALAARFCQAGAASWRLARAARREGTAASWSGGGPRTRAAARDCCLLLATLLARGEDGGAEGGACGKSDGGEAVVEALGEALEVSAEGPRAGGGGAGGAAGPAAAPVAAEGHPDEEAAVLAVWAGLRRRAGAPACAASSLLGRLAAAGRRATAASSAGWGRAAGALRRRPAEATLPVGIHHRLQAGAILVVQLEEMGLERLPLALCAHATNLRTLDVSHNRIVELAEQVRNLLALKTLRVAANALTIIPEAVADLPSLTELNIAGNQIHGASAHAADCRRLVVLDASAQRMGQGPGAAAGPPARGGRGLRAGAAPRSAALETLEVSFSGLAEGPYLEVGSGAALRYYLCIGNNLDKCPDFKRCPGLTSLSLGQNLLRALPARVVQGLAELRWLSLEANRLPKLPGAVGTLKHLRHLMLQGNRLETLPEEIGSCSQLRVLEVQHNRLAELPASLARLRSLQFLYAHGNVLRDATEVFAILRAAAALKLVGLGGNRLELQGLGRADQLLPHARVGLGWNAGGQGFSEVQLTELLSCGEGWHFEPGSADGGRGRVLVVCFSAQGAPTAQWTEQVDACRSSLLEVDALYVSDPANAWYLQDPTGAWRGIEYFTALLRRMTADYGRRVLLLGSSMGATACLLFSELAGLAMAFSPQVELRAGQGRFLQDEVLDRFEAQVARSLRACGGRVIVHVGRRHHFDSAVGRRLLGMAPCVRLAYHETEQHNTTKFLHERLGQLSGMVKTAVAQMHAAAFAD